MMNVDYIETWKEVMKSPSDFYREMPKTGGYFHPIVFATASLAIMLSCALLIYPLIFPEMGTTKLTYMEISLIVIFLFVVFILGLLMNAAILNITYKILGGKGSYEGTVGFVYYATAALVLAWIPLIGGIFGLYQTYLYIVGGKFVHGMSMVRSVFAFIMSGILVLVFVVLASFSGLV
ncbi:YIP1 family protein [Methanosarcina sp. T3]|uniref:YIP1 family protein n=1 Tax=Methanosarcina sp. T3 TaxID=3439062 RepID=UPI003F87FE2D